MKKTIFTTIFLFLFLVSTIFVCADKFVIQEQRFGELNVVGTQQYYYPVGQNFNFSFHIYNSTGFVLVNADCMIHVYDEQNNHLYDEVGLVVSANSVDYSILMNSTITSVQGGRPYKVYCNNSEAGTESGIFYMTPDGFELQNVGDFDYLVILLIIMFISGMSLVVSNMFVSEKFFGFKIIFFIWGFLQILITLPMMLLTQSNYTSPTALFDWFVVFFAIDVFLLIIFVLGYWLIVGGSMIKFFVDLARKRKTKEIKYK